MKAILFCLDAVISNTFSINTIINGEYEIWDTSFNEMLINKLSLEQMLRMLPVYKGYFGETVTEPCIVVQGKRIVLSETDISVVNELYVLNETEKELEILNKRIGRSLKKLNNSISEINITISI